MAAGPTPIDMVFVGGGHSHALVLDTYIHDPSTLPPGPINMTVVSDADTAYYSGMMPGAVAGSFTDATIQIDLGPLVADAGGVFVRGRVVDLVTSASDLEQLGSAHPEAGIRASHKGAWITVGGDVLPFHVTSIDVGSVTRGSGLSSPQHAVPGVAEHAVATRPIGSLLARMEEAEQQREGHVAVVVVGGGAAGIELAATYRARLVGMGVERPNITLVTADETIHARAGEKASAAVSAAFEERDIAVVVADSVVRVDQDAVVLRSGTSLPCDLCLWAAGAAPQPLMAAMAASVDGLQLSDRGYLLVADTLSSVSHPFIFGAGDTITIREHPRVPKAGVYAVREAPFLTRNLSAFIATNRDVLLSPLDDESGMQDYDTSALEPYVPQEGFLSLLALGESKAIGVWKGMVFSGSWVWRLKKYIDMKFMLKFPQPQERDDAPGSSAHQSPSSSFCTIM